MKDKEQIFAFMPPALYFVEYGYLYQVNNSFHLYIQPVTQYISLIKQCQRTDINNIFAETLYRLVV